MAYQRIKPQEAYTLVTEAAWHDGALKLLQIASPTLTTASWICSQQPRVQILNHVCKRLTGLPLASWDS